MTAAPPPDDDLLRYTALMNHRLTRSVIGDAKSVTLVTEAARRFGVPVASIGVVGREKVHLVAEVGTQFHIIPRAYAFSTLAIMQDAPLVIEDATRHPSLSSHPGIVARQLRFLAAAPLIDRHGYRLGGFCVMDRAPRTMSPQDIADLVRYAARAMARIDFLANIAELSRQALPYETAARRRRDLMVW
jgi:two-component system, OmpR family, sensor histidine kinase VicK